MMVGWWVIGWMDGLDALRSRSKPVDKAMRRSQAASHPAFRWNPRLDADTKRACAGMHASHTTSHSTHSGHPTIQRPLALSSPLAGSRQQSAEQPMARGAFDTDDTP